ncbi:hypothetical protein HELRODRAFT_190598 [Helobdella robusta]|uniref:AMOP domain-containing protein n=1 Tax=Helobdella robusta TaxID=6412 RepID=T1FS43_HELRO|nr:hypothetical protein HELRODRAFT_190598 [Helobdella robusta]ESO08773.1 hypothetical protein HELRODRAFT_190598 [Helobdella robusta]
MFIKTTDVIAIVATVAQILASSASGASFLPHGFDVGDQLSRDGNVNLTTSRKFLFFDQISSFVIVRNENLMYFKRGSENNYSVSFNGTGPTGQRYTFFRESTEPGVLANIDKILCEASEVCGTFKSSWMFLITVVSQNTGQDSCNRDGLCPARILYQIAYTTNGAASYMLFIQDKDAYTLSNVGIIHGNVMNSKNVITNFTTDIIVFKVNEKCSVSLNLVNNVLTVRPESVLYFGQQEVIFEGLCFDEGTDETDVLMNNTAVQCSVESNFIIICRTPYFDEIGKLDVEVKYKYFQYSAVLNVRDVRNESQHYIFVDDMNNLVGSVKLPLTQENVINHLSEVLVRGVQQNIYHNTMDDSYRLDSNDVYIRLPVTLSASNYFPMRFLPSSEPIPDAVRILLSYNEKTFEVFLSKKHVKGQTMCSYWKSTSNYQQLSNYNSFNSYNDFYGSCPKSINQTTSVTILLPDQDCNPYKRYMCNLLKPNISECFQSSSNPYYNNFGYPYYQTKYSKCCYGYNGQLNQDESYLSYADTEKKFDHFWNKIRPFLYCCKFSDDCADVKKKLGI